MQKKPNFADFISGNGANIAGGGGNAQCAMRSRTRMKQGKAFIAIVCPQTHPLSTCSALSRPMGATRHTGCSLPSRVPACNLFPHLVARHVTIAFQLYPDCTFCVFLQKNPCFFTFSTFLFLVSVIESKREYFLLCSRTSGSSNLKVPFLLALVLSRFYFHFFLSTLKEVLSRG